MGVPTKSGYIGANSQSTSAAADEGELSKCLKQKWKTTARVRNATKIMEETGNLIQKYDLVRIFQKEIKQTQTALMPLSEGDQEFDQQS